MKPEPLKNKKTNMIKHGTNKMYDGFYYDDIKSAVEWLKEQFPIYKQDLYTSSSIFNKIDKAFEDVIKK